ncbi:MAG TPA: hypothetical protein VJM15_00855 [Sphingomicrobium sp.]|nr:hypothetical protein [Sphingomicrobium sp.]
MNDPDGRYARCEIRYRVGPDGKPVAFLSRRFLPDPAGLRLAGHVRMEAGDRLDLLSARVQGSSAAWWRIADAARIIHPDELEEPPLQRLGVPLPEAGS